MTEELQKYFSIIKASISIIEKSIKLDDLYHDLESINKFLVDCHSNLTKLHGRVIELKNIITTSKLDLYNIDLFDYKNKYLFEDLSTKILNYMKEYRICNEKYSFMVGKTDSYTKEQSSLKNDIAVVCELKSTEKTSLKKVLDNVFDNYVINDNLISSRFFEEYAKLAIVIGRNILYIEDNNIILNGIEKSKLLKILTTIRNNYTSSIVIRKSINNKINEENLLIINEYFENIRMFYHELNENTFVSEILGNTTNLDLFNTLYIMGLDKKYSDTDIDLTTLYGSFDEDLNRMQKLILTKKA